MIEIEDINRFESSKRLCSFFGVHPKFKQSGDKIAGIRMSKQGSSEMRAILYMVAKSAMVYNPHIRKIYDRFKQQGMAHNQAMGVIMHKILRIIYGMLKSKTEYVPEVDIENQQRTIASQPRTKKVQTDGKKKQRYQELSTEAPISKIELKKRKEQLSSPSP
jgi:transposase